MVNMDLQQKYEKKLKKLKQKKKYAELKCMEKRLRREVWRVSMPFLFSLKFNKLIVFFCIISIVLYTFAAIMLQKYTSMEISPTLTTCVFAFFGTELLGLAGIRIFDKKYETAQPSTTYVNETNNGDNDAVG